jgi:hypothetical protein
MKICRESRGAAPLILNIGAGSRSVFNVTPLLVYPRGHKPLYPLNTRLGESQSRSARVGRKSLFLAWNQNPDHLFWSSKLYTFTNLFSLYTLKFRQN